MNRLDRVRKADIGERLNQEGARSGEEEADRSGECHNDASADVQV